MNLLEHEGKALLRSSGVAVPQGAVWPELPQGARRCVVKAQVPAGRRGKRGGVKFADGEAEIGEAVRAMLAQGIAGAAVRRAGLVTARIRKFPFR